MKIYMKIGFSVLTMRRVAVIFLFIYFFLEGGGLKV